MVGNLHAPLACQSQRRSEDNPRPRSRPSLSSRVRLNAATSLRRVPLISVHLTEAHSGEVVERPGDRLIELIEECRDVLRGLAPDKQQAKPSLQPSGGAGNRQRKSVIFRLPADLD